MNKTLKEYKKILYSLPKEIKEKLKAIVKLRQKFTKEYLDKFSKIDLLYFEISKREEFPESFSKTELKDIVRLENEAKELAYEMSLIQQQTKLIRSLCPVAYGWIIKKNGKLCLRKIPKFFKKVNTNDEFNQKLKEFQSIIVHSFEPIKYSTGWYAKRKNHTE